MKFIPLLPFDGLEKEEETMWECSICGYLVIGRKAPLVQGSGPAKGGTDHCRNRKNSIPGRLPAE
ncbi:MAG: hypothetical protein GX660_01725 [Clostridiaceae bacterium]|nr:hypothetical protein [Clostridiaceae bacterium]